MIEEGADLASDVRVGPYSIVSGETTIGSGTSLGGHVVTEGRVRIGENNTISDGVIIGTRPQSRVIEHEDTGVWIGDDNVLREYVTINRAMEEAGKDTRIGNNNMLMAYSHVAHDCLLEDEVTLTNSVALAGHVTIEERVNVGGLTAFHQHVRVGAYAMIGGLSRINQDVVPYIRVAGNPAEVYDLNAIGLRRNGFDREARSRLKEAFRYLFREGLNTSQALQKIRREMPENDSVRRLVEFVEASDRGIQK